MTHLRRFVVAAGISSALIGSGTALAAVGDRVATVQLPQFAIGVGIAFDGVRLYYTSGEHLLSFDPDNPAGTLMSVLVNDGTDNIALNALSYDRTRDVLWAVRHNTDLVYTVDKVTGAATFVLDATGRCLSCNGIFRDGLAFDAGILTDPLDDALWWSRDGDWGVYKLNLAGGVIESFDVRGPDGVSGTGDDIDASLSVHGNSGVVPAGPYLYLGSANGKTIVTVDLVTKTFVDVFPDVSEFTVEDMECDAHTFAPVPVMWVRAGDLSTGAGLDTVSAFELEPGACPPAFGGSIIGGGSVLTAAGTRVAHGLTVHCDVDPGKPNHLQVNWAGNRFHLETLTSALCVDDPAIAPEPGAAWFDTLQASGTGRYNGVSGATIQITLKDAGEPGQNDTTQITIRDASNAIVLSVSGRLERGNHQVRDE
jgi:hypothetical protein